MRPGRRGRARGATRRVAAAAVVVVRARCQYGVGGRLRRVIMSS